MVEKRGIGGTRLLLGLLVNAHGIQVMAIDLVVYKQIKNHLRDRSMFFHYVSPSVRSAQCPPVKPEYFVDKNASDIDNLL